MLDAGADKVSVNSAALERPELISELAEVFGSQCVVIAIDAKRRGAGDESETCQAPPGFFGDAEWDVYAHGGRTRVEGREAVAWARGGDRARGGGGAADQHGPRRDHRRLRPRADPLRWRRRSASR